MSQRQNPKESSPTGRARQGPRRTTPGDAEVPGRRLYVSRVADATQDAHLNLISRYTTKNVLVSVSQ